MHAFRGIHAHTHTISQENFECLFIVWLLLDFGTAQIRFYSTKVGQLPSQDKLKPKLKSLKNWETNSFQKLNEKTWQQRKKRAKKTKQKSSSKKGAQQTRTKEVKFVFKLFNWHERTDLKAHHPRDMDHILAPKFPSWLLIEILNQRMQLYVSNNIFIMIETDTGIMKGLSNLI